MENLTIDLKYYTRRMGNVFYRIVFRLDSTFNEDLVRYRRKYYFQPLTSLDESLNYVHDIFFFNRYLYR